MPLEPDQMLSHYRLVEKIGQGGMGEVWRAHDTSLERDVALKLLPESLADDAERLARFDREAKLLASLNHPHIAAIHGLHEQEGTRFLVMELVPGANLRVRLADGPLPPEEAIELARQIAEALEAAHDNGIVHRDLKPENIQVTPEDQVKVLDFGLAKAFAPEPASASASLSPTITADATQAGLILGTAAYMSPEQAKGKAVDRRADIWAFGAVLLEMLTGRMVFGAESVSETLAKVMLAPVGFDALPTETPAPVERLLERCLEREPRRRLRDIGEARVLLEDLQAGRGEPGSAADAAATSVPAFRGRLAIGIIGGILLGAMLTAWALRSPPPEPPSVRRFSIPLEKLGGWRALPQISPDGSHIAYTHGDKLWVREIDRFEPRVLVAMDGVSSPFWSPDSRWIGFTVDDRILKVATEGGEPVQITRHQNEFSSGVSLSWGDNGRIVFTAGAGGISIGGRRTRASSRSTGIYEVSDRGGEATLLHSPMPEIELDLHQPQALPEGRGILFVVHRMERETEKLSGADTLTVLSEGERQIILHLEGRWISNPHYSPSGHVLFNVDGDEIEIWAMPFSLARLEPTGEPFLVVPSGSLPSTSADGTLVYSSAGTFIPRRQLVLFGEQGTVVREIGEPQGALVQPYISPDSRRLAVVAKEGDDFNVWIRDLVRGTNTRLTFESGFNFPGSWLPGGDELFVANDIMTPSARLVIRRADGTGEPVLVHQGPMFVSEASRDGRHVLISVRDDQNDNLMYIRRGEEDAVPVPFLDSSANESAPAISPDGRYVAYQSDESGRGEIYLTGFPSSEGRWQVSRNGGAQARWGSDGKQLFFVAGNALMVVDLEIEPSPRLGKPRTFLSGIKLPRGIRTYAVMPDGSGIIVSRDVEQDDKDLAVPEILVVENWLAEVE